MSSGPIARRVLDRLRQQVRTKITDLAAFREGNAYAEALQNSVVAADKLQEMHPAHAIYVHVQNQMSVMAEQLLQLREMKVFVKLLSAAEDEYMPSWPPMSPVTKTFFWCWANFDAAVNARRETIGSVTLSVAAEFGAHPAMLTLMRTLTDSRMGIFRVEGYRGSDVKLRELSTDQLCLAVCESGYIGSVGELWFARVLPPALPGQAEHVVFTSPYVLIEPNADAWINYFNRIAAQDPQRPRIEALEQHLKWGNSPRYWNEFVFEGYVNHTSGAIFLKGLPDIPESRPHSKEYGRDAHGH
jgi:hypothetical protein